MESGEDPTDFTTAFDLAPPPPSQSPPHDVASSPGGSPEHIVRVDLPTPSDEDREHHQRHDDDLGEDHGGNQVSDSGVLTEDLKHKIIKQVEYYFSDENLPTDKYLLSLIKKNKEGFVPISTIASFRKMKKLTRHYPLILDTLKESSLLVVSSDGKKVKRLNTLQSVEVKDPKLFTVLAENLPEDHSVQNIRRIFGEAGNIRNICIRDPHTIEESKKGGKREILISSKLHALVEYEAVEAAEKAVATLNNEQDWRHGLRVKLLKQVGKYGQRRQQWREPDPEKNGAGLVHEQTGVEENNKASDHHHDTPDEEFQNGGHHQKEKNGQRGRNRGNSRRQKYHGINGLGHGTTSSHAVEVSRPPPGPKMPDGTRGFTMGRGRPLSSDRTQKLA